MERTVGMDIRDAQARMALFFREQHWDYSLQDTFMHLMEEVGELTWYARRPQSSTPEKVEDELADVLALVLHAANVLKIDAESAWLKKLEKEKTRVR